MEPKFWIDYPQEHIEGEMYKYRCSYCKIETTAINGLIENHKKDCTFRIEQEKTYRQTISQKSHIDVNQIRGADETD